MPRPMHCVIVLCVAALLPVYGASAAFVEFAVTIDGFQASVETTGTGSGTVLLNTTLNVLHWSIDYQNLSGPLTAAHFHGAAGICEPAGVQVPISGAGPATGSIMGPISPIARPKERTPKTDASIALHTGRRPPALSPIVMTMAVSSPAPGSNSRPLQPSVWSAIALMNAACSGIASAMRPKRYLPTVALAA